MFWVAVAETNSITVYSILENCSVQGLEVEATIQVWVVDNVHFISVEVNLAGLMLC